MKNLEKHIDELLKDADEFNCTCCKLRLGYELDCDELTNIECEKHKELNKAWLKAEYVPREAVYILRNLLPEYKYIRRDKTEITISEEEIFRDSFTYMRRCTKELNINECFKYKLFEFLPLNENVSISNLLEQYKDVY
jgi:hypothetical protein